MTKKAGIVHPSIFASERIASLGLKGALLYTWLLVAADHQGRLAGDARKIKALVVPLIDEIDVKDIDEALGAMGAGRLVILYNDPETGRRLIQVAGWWEYNAGMRYVKASKWPPPEGWEDRPETGRDDTGRFSAGPRRY